MGDLSLERLSVADAPALFTFEKRNKAWFETHVGPRPDNYQDPFRLTDLVREQVEAGELMFLLKAKGNIIGRVNLTGVEAGVAQLGYRIGQEHAGRGAATRGVALIVEQAQDLGLRAIVARVKLDNLASMRVLQKNDFYATGYDTVGDAECKTFCRDLS